MNERYESIHDQCHALLDELNRTYTEVHIPYEEAFWKSHMGDLTVTDAYVVAKKALDGFRESREMAARVDEVLVKMRDEVWGANVPWGVGSGAGSEAASEVGAGSGSGSEAGSEAVLIDRLEQWQHFFSLYQSPDEVVAVKEQITILEKEIEIAKTRRDYGYIDPVSWTRVQMSPHGMVQVMRTHDDERVRKACREGVEATIGADVDAYVRLVEMRNRYARSLGYEHFYEYKAQIEERMSAQEIWDLFDQLRENAEPAYQYVRDQEAIQPWLRDPWNYGYMITGEFTKQEDPYLPLGQTVLRRVQSMSACGIRYRGATLVLDLLEREGKYNNWFCHMPRPVWYEGERRHAAQINFTCNAIPWHVGDGHRTGVTLFHEWGHAAHFANMDCRDVMLNTEHPPASTAWAETQSMFLDSLCSSIDWKMRYATRADGWRYPRALHEQKVRTLQPLALKWLMGIAMIVDFERRVYTDPALSPERVMAHAAACSDRYLDYSQPFHFALLPVHLYSWDSACSYHGYGLASLAVAQWKAWWYAHDGYIVDNPTLWPVMEQFWALGSRYWFGECVERATGKPLSVDDYVAFARMSADEKLQADRDRLERMRRVPTYATGACSLQGERLIVNDAPLFLDAHIRIVHGDVLIADSQDGWLLAMAQQFGAWIASRG
jgi:hypothetical protein